MYPYYRALDDIKTLFLTEYFFAISAWIVIQKINKSYIHNTYLHEENEIISPELHPCYGASDNVKPLF